MRPRYFEINAERVGGELIFDTIPEALSPFIPSIIRRFKDINEGSTIEFSVVKSGDNINIIEDSIFITDPGEYAYDWIKVGPAWFHPENHTIFEAHAAIAQNGGLHGNILLVGASGYGKTTLPKAWAQGTGMAFVRANVALLRGKGAIFGTSGFKDGSTTFNPSEVSEILTQGNAVMLLDELSRTDQKNLNDIFSLLDDDRRVVLNTSEGNIVVEVGHNVIICGSANIGWQYTGTEEIDAALVNRFADRLIVRRPPKNIEIEILLEQSRVNLEEAELIVTIMNNIRNNEHMKNAPIDITTRAALQVATKSYYGVPLDLAFKTNILNKLIEYEDAHKDIKDIVRSYVGV